MPSAMDSSTSSPQGSADATSHFPCDNARTWAESAVMDQSNFGAGITGKIPDKLEIPNDDEPSAESSYTHSEDKLTPRFENNSRGSSGVVVDRNESQTPPSKVMTNFTEKGWGEEYQEEDPLKIKLLLHCAL